MKLKTQHEGKVYIGKELLGSGTVTIVGKVPENPWKHWFALSEAKHDTARIWVSSPRQTVVFDGDKVVSIYEGSELVYSYGAKNK